MAEVLTVAATTVAEVVVVLGAVGMVDAAGEAMVAADEAVAAKAEAAMGAVIVGVEAASAALVAAVRTKPNRLQTRNCVQCIHR